MPSHLEILQLRQRHPANNSQIDRLGFVYAVCSASKQVMVISQDGKQSRVILSQDDGMDEMFAVNIDRKTSTLLVCDWSNGTAFLFQI